MFKSTIMQAEAILMAEHATMLSALRLAPLRSAARQTSRQTSRHPPPSYLAAPFERASLWSKPYRATPVTMQQASARERQEEVARIEHLPDDQKKQLDERARQGETVVPGGTGGKSLD
ncbi:hypothetical protein KFL_003880010, partial [Klebsormidium nitens]